MQKHKMTTFTNNKKGQYKLHHIDAVKTNQLKNTYIFKFWQHRSGIVLPHQC